MAGKVDRLLADALHQAAVAGDHIGVVVDEVGADSARCSMRSASAMPTAVARPCPSGPVVVSTPGGVAVFGMARRARAELPEAPELVERHAA